MQRLNRLCVVALTAALLLLLLPRPTESWCDADSDCNTHPNGAGICTLSTRTCDCVDVYSFEPDGRNSNEVDGR
jgi:hypothetical protein